MSASHNLEKLTVLAADFGLPVQWFNWAGGWLLGCEYCYTAGTIVALYEGGKITREEHRDLFLKVANAKSQDDMAALMELKGVLRGTAHNLSGYNVSPPQEYGKPVPSDALKKT